MYVRTEFDLKVGAALALPWLADIDQCRDAIEALDIAGLDHVTVPTNALSAVPGRYPDLPDDAYASTKHDPFILFASVARTTRTIKFRTAVLILPALQTVMVAKQAADVAILSAGRLELGVGIGWGNAEFEALDYRVSERGTRMTEQIEVLRLLWSSPNVTFDGKYHHIDGLGLGECGLPPRPIPIWIGSSASDPPLRRAARLADGWLPFPAASKESIDRLRVLEADAGRSACSVAVSGRVTAEDDVVEQARLQIERGATELTISVVGQSTENTVVGSIHEGVDRIRRAAHTLVDAGISTPSSP